MNISPAMINLLKRLKSQAEAAVNYPGAYSPELWLGTFNVNTRTGHALARRGLVDTGERCGFETVTINEAGRKALEAA